jgi:hypothetical protein
LPKDILRFSGFANVFRKWKQGGPAGEGVADQTGPTGLSDRVGRSDGGLDLDANHGFRLDPRRLKPSRWRAGFASMGSVCSERY